MSATLRFALIGCGDFGASLGRYARAVADIVALCDVKLERAEAAAKQLGLGAPTYADYRDLLAQEELDAVLIVAANFVHAEIAVAAAEAGVHVYCEKAMARTVPECWQMVRACQRNNVKLMVGHKRRLRPPWARMIELTDDDLLGKPLSITVAGYADMRPYNMYERWWADPELSGGPLAWLGVHVIDWFGAMCGPASRVWGMYGPQNDSRWPTPDVINATFEFKSGALASLNGSSRFPLHTLRQAQGPIGQCEHGGLKLVPEMEYIDLYWQRDDEAQLHHERFDDLGFEHAFHLEISDFARWILEDRPPCLTWVEGLRCVEMMEAVYRSAERGGLPVDLPLYPELEQQSKL